MSKQNNISWDNFITLKFDRLPRLYRLFRVPVLLLLYRLPGLLKFVYKQFKVSQLMIRILNTFLPLIILIHIMACSWATAAFFELDSGVNWLRQLGIDDEDIFTQYLAAFYWAVVTATTVGYGDITPTNEFEKGIAAIIIVAGVAYYSFIISDLSYVWALLESSSQSMSKKESAITDFAKKHQIPEDLTRKLKYYFSTQKNIISLGKESNIDTLVSTLPSHLKSKVYFILYKEAIQKIKFLQTSYQQFHLEFLPRLHPIIVKKGTQLIKENRMAQEVYFIMKGLVRNMRTNTLYRDGAMIGETDIFFKNMRKEGFMVEEDSHLLKMDKIDFEEAMSRFPDIREEVAVVAKEREKLRNETYREQLFAQFEVSKERIMDQIKVFQEKVIKEQTGSPQHLARFNLRKQRRKSQIGVLRSIKLDMMKQIQSSNLGEIEEQLDRTSKRIKDMRDDDKESQGSFEMKSSRVGTPDQGEDVQLIQPSYGMGFDLSVTKQQDKPVKNGKEDEIVLETEVKELQTKMNECLGNLKTSKEFIIEYLKIFKEFEEKLRQNDCNEWIIETFKSGSAGLENYLKVIQHVENCVDEVRPEENMQIVKNYLAHTQKTEKNQYLMESMINKGLHKVEKIKKIKYIIEDGKRVRVVIKENPLLDKRDESHNQHHSKIGQSKEMNF